MKKIQRGLVLGRFQPIHKGHILIIQQALNENDEVIIMIAAAQYSHSIKNPFTASERYQMIRLAVIEKWGPEILTRLHIIPVFDINDNSLWVTHLERILPPFNVIYGNNPFTRLLFQEKGYNVKQTGLVNRNEYSGIKIREMILQGNDLSNVLQTSTIQFLQQMNAQKRLQACTDTDEDPKTRN